MTVRKPPGAALHEDGTQRIERNGAGLQATRSRLRRVARLLDSGLAVPGTSWRIGLEALIGLIPGIGDLAGALLGAYFVVEALQLRAPRGVIGRMLGNIVLDLLLGVLPVVGDVADFAFKSNERNLRLLDRHLDDRLGVAPPPRRRRYGPALAAALLALLLLAGLWWLLRSSAHT
ncbi:DUF4112 domain-containing protein [Solimonas soli]|uniref:DUF4112 domain-containing protein n=1 Tax=Solimonas soli TaxID=413479 RepID=UPI0004B09091|nr:DUF4112 domain-containing protein [Solimonas soli]